MEKYKNTIDELHKNDASLTEKVYAHEQLFKGRVLDVQKWLVTLPNKDVATREVVLLRGASAIVPVDSEGNVYLVRQYRVPLGKVLVEIPAGKLDYIDEDRLEAAKRELKEETGFTADKWIHLTELAMTPGCCSEVISIYLALDLNAGDTDFDDDEFLDVIKMPLADALEMVKLGLIQDSKTVCGLLLAENKLKEAQ